VPIKRIVNASPLILLSKIGRIDLLTLLGTVGLVILANRLGRIAEARPIIEDLRRAGLYVTDLVIADALKRAGE
jgi:predicted nucleic acid-binding protein